MNSTGNEKELCELKIKVNEHSWQLKQTEQSLKKLESSDEAQWSKLRGVKQTITIVKWTSVGIALTIMADQIGLGQLIRLLGV